LTRTFRDDVLGAALRQLEAPEHRPEFYPELYRLQAREQVDRDSFTLELGEVVAAVGYNPLVPAWLPEGYRPAGVAVHPGTGSPTGVEGSNPPSTGVVSLSSGNRAERVSIGRGALSGVEAGLLLVPRTVPLLRALTDELVVTVSGELSSRELVRVAESLEPRS
jgi:hypothetical protein